MPSSCQAWPKSARPTCRMKEIQLPLILSGKVSSSEYMIRLQAGKLESKKHDGGREHMPSTKPFDSHRQL